MLKVTYFQTSMDMVPHKCSTIVSLPVHSEGIQSFVEAPDKRTLAFHKFPLADFIDLCELLPLCVHIDILSSLLFEVAFVFYTYYLIDSFLHVYLLLTGSLMACRKNRRKYPSGNIVHYSWF